MAKKKYEVIDIDNMTADVVIDKSKKNALDFNGKTWAEAISSVESVGDNLVITTTNANGYKVILTDYFAKNGKHSIKWINTAGTRESDIAILDYVNAEDIYGTTQTSATAKKGKITGTVFNDRLTGVGENDERINGLGGNDIIDGGKGNDTITGGEGRNTILLSTTTDFGNDTVVLTKNEHLKLKLDVNEDGYFETDLVGKDLKLTVYSESGYTGDTHNGTVRGTVTIKNYTKKDVLTSAGSFTIVGNDDIELYNFREDLTQETDMDSKEGHYNKSSFTGSWVDDGVYAENFKLYKNGKKISTDSSKGTEITTETEGYETVKGVTINLGGATYYNETTGSKYADTIKGGANDDDIEGGKGNDNIKGGAGHNTLYYFKGDGHDTVTLTKGEQFDLYFDAINLEDLKFAYSKNDLKLYYEEDGAEAGSITLKNFANKDVTNNSTKKNPIDSSFVNISFYDNEEHEYISYELRTDLLIKTEVDKANFTGKWLRDYIDASNSDELLKKGKHVNMVLNGGKGDDYIVGSDYADTLKGGDGDDVITGGKGDDFIYGEAGKNTLRFESGDGADTVYSGKGEDTLKFIGKDNSLALMQFERGRNSKGKQTSDLIIHYGMDRESYITVKNYYDKNGDPSDKCSVKYIQIGEGEPVDIETARKQAEQAVESGEAVFGGGQITAKEQTKFVVGSNNADAIDLAPSAQTDVSVYAGDGNDSVTGKEDTITKYTITAGNGNKTITTSAGSDEITVGDGTHTINAGGGNNVINAGDNTSTEARATVTTGSGADNITVGDGGYNINAGSGNDEIKSGAGDDIITVTSGTDIINAGDGVNIIETGSGQKTITVGDSTVTDPEDDNYNLGSTITLGYNNTNSEITTGTGDDTININHNSSSQGIKITSDGGDNKINIDDEGVYSMTVETGEGDDNLTSTGQIGKYSASFATKIDLGGGDNTVSITNSGIYDTTIETGDGNDTIDLDGWGDSNKITSTGGNNEITYASKITGWNNQAGAEITTGDGDDTITIGGFDEEGMAVGSVGGNIIKAGNGDNEITIAYGSDNSITTGSGNDKIYIANKSESNSAYDNNIDAGDGDNEIELKSGDNNTITAGSGNDKITVYQRGGNNTITSTGGNNEIYYGKGMEGQGGSESDPQKITTGAGNDKIYIGNVVDGAKNGGVNYITIDAGDGDNELYMGYASAHGNIKTGSGNDKIYYNQGDENNFSYENTIDAGEGKNEIYITKGYKYNITTGSGDDIITKGNSGGYISADKKTTISAGDGHNVITLKDGAYDITTGDSTVTDKSVENYNIGSEINITSDSNIQYLNIETGSGDDTITMNKGGGYGSSITIDAGDGDNHIEYANNKVTGYIGYGATITTGSGDDTIIVGMFDKEGIGTDSPEVNVINAGGGDNEITIARGQENNITTTGDGTNTISINGYSYLNTITTGDGDDTIELGKNTTDYNQNNTITAGNGTNTITIGNEDSKGNNYNEITTGSGDDTITLGKHSGHNTITTGDGVDSITLGTYSDNNTITTGDGKKTITIGDNSAGNEITTGSGNDVITLGAGSGNIVNTGDGADTVTMYSATLNTGTGNDTVYLKGSASGTELTMGTGDDTLDVSEVTAACDYNIHFNTGDGKDTVEGITPNGRYFFNITSDYLVVKRRSTVEGHTNDLELVMYDKTGTEVTDDLITIENYYGEGGDPVNTQIYVNGTNINYIPEGIITGEGEINGTNNSDYIFGSDSDDTIKPKEGKDFISSGKGNDIIDFEDNNDKKYVYYNKGDGDLTLKNISTTSSSENSGIHLYMEDIEAETTVYERHGCDMHIIRDLGNDETEKVVLKDVFSDIDDTGIVENVYLYTEDGKYLGLIYSYPKIMHIYPDEATGILAGDEYVEQNLYYTNAASNRIIIPDEYDVANYVYASNITNPDTLDLSWCSSDGYCKWNKDEDGNLVITSVIDNTVDPEEMWKESNTVKTTIVGFYNSENAVKNFKFKSYTRNYSEILMLANEIEITPENEGETITGTWVQDGITQNGVINNITINSGDGNDTINIHASQTATINGGKGNDTISAGGSATNYLTGGVGNDSIIGTNTSQDYFIFNHGDGNDVIYGGDLSGKKDTIKIDGFADKDNPDLTHRFDGRDLILEYNYVDEVPQDSITIRNYLDENGVRNSSVKDIIFGDGNGNWTNPSTLAYKFRKLEHATGENKNLVGTPFDDYLFAASSDIEGVTVNGGTGDDTLVSTMYKFTFEFSDFGGHDQVMRNTLWKKESYIKFTDLDLADTSKFKFALEGNNMLIYYANSGDDTTQEGYVFPNSVKLLDYDEQYNPASEQYYQINQLLGKDDTIETANPEYTILKLYKNYINIEGAGQTVGTKYRDVITGSEAFNNIRGAYGDDIIYGSTGGDEAHGGAGDDLIDYSTIAQGSTLYGDTGNDTIYGGSEDDTIYGGSSSDASDDDGNDLIYGGDGNDQIWTGNGNNTVYGGNGKDYVYLGNGTNAIRTENGNDYVEGGLGNDTIYCGEGDDYVFESGGTNHIYGGAGSDELRAFNGNNTLYFSEGDGIDDVYFSSASGQTLKFLDQDFDDLTMTVDRENNLFNIAYGTGDDNVVVHGLTNAVNQMYVTDQNGERVNVRYSYSEGGNTGTEGKDALYGIAGVNTFWGKRGDDLFFSGGSADKYRFGKGDGHDTIVVGGNDSNLNFEESAIDDLNFAKDGDDLVVTSNGDTDSVRVKDYYKNGSQNFKFTTSDTTQYDVDSDGRNHINDSTSATITGDIFNDYITINAANTSISGGTGHNFYTYDANVLNDGVERTLNIDNYATDTLTFKNWAGLTGLTTSVDGDDILITNGGVDPTIKIRITDGFKYKKPLTIEEYGVTPSETLLTYMANDHIWFDGSFAAEGTTYDDSIRVIPSELVQTGGSVKGDSGSDLIVADRDSVQIATNNFASTEASRQDTSAGIVEDVILNGKTYTVFAQSETNNILSNNTESNDFYYSYINQNTNITDMGGTNDKVSLLNTWTSGYENEDGKYKIGTTINTNLFFRVEPDAYSVFDVEIGQLSDMENAAQGHDHKGIKILNNAVEKVTTSDGYSISSADIATLAQYAAGWISSEGYTSYEDMATRGGADALKDYVNVINKEADIQGYWVKSV